MISFIAVNSNIDINFLLDEMTTRQANFFISEINNKEKNKLENIRTICFFVCQTQSNKALKPTDIMKFSWDKKEIVHKKITTEEKQKLQEKSNELLNKLNKKK